MLQERTDPRVSDCTHTVMRRAVWMSGKGWICADDDHPGCHYRIEETEAPCREAKYWKDRFIGMRRAYREELREGLSPEDWHAKHCAAFVAAKDMQRAIATLVDEYRMPTDVDRRLRALLPKPPAEPPACSHDDAEPR